jgi:hypothetical protein
MKVRHAKVLLHLAGPTIGNDVRRLVRELAALAGVARVVPGARVPRLLHIDYDPAVIGARSLLACARRGWTAARLAGPMPERGSDRGARS